MTGAVPSLTVVVHAVALKRSKLCINDLAVIRQRIDKEIRESRRYLVVAVDRQLH